jgi:hypothetical protein
MLERANWLQKNNRISSAAEGFTTRFLNKALAKLEYCVLPAACNRFRSRRDRIIGFLLLDVRDVNA